MNKRKPFILALMLTFSCASACGIMTACDGCNDETKLNIIESKDGYDWKYNQNFVDEMDADMKIDGKLDEARWKESGKKWLTHAEKNVNMRYTTSFTAKGLYIAAEAKDPLMQWNETRDFANNSSFYFYIVSENATEYHAFDCMGFYVDELHSACRQNTRFAAKASRTVDENGVPTLTAEFFSSWEALNYSVDEATGIPESAKFIPEYRFVEAVDSKENAYLKPALAEHGSNKVNNAYKFSKDGYINVDAEGAELGNGDNGFAKSDGWDLSAVKGDESGVKKITSNVYGDQAIFFKGINSSRYSYTVDIEYKQSYGTAFPAAGVLDMKDASDFNIMRFHGNDITGNSNNYRYFRLDFHNGRSDNQQGNLSVTPGTRKITVRVIKDDSRYYYIFGNYEYSIELSWLGGKTIPGLYTFDAEVEFSNWHVTDYEGAEKDAAFKELCAQYMHTVKVDTSISGGTVAVDKLAVKKDAEEKVSVSVTPTRGYVLTDLTINGKSEYDALLSQMINGVITLTPDKALEIGATFSAMPASSTLRITGTVKRDTGDNLIGMSYAVRSNEEETKNLLYNYGVTTSSGIFDITVLRAGTHNIGGKTITTDGKYTLAFDGIFPRGESSEFVIDTNDEKFTGNYYSWGDIVINPLKVVNMAETDDGQIRTTHTVYDQSQIFSYFIGNETVTGSFRLDMTISAGNDKWPCYGFTVEDENNNSLQLFAAGATTFRIMKGYDGVNYTQTDKNATFIDGVSRIRLIYSEKDDTFSFYVNDILFETLKRTDYLTGTHFKYGPVGYMSGADGSNSPVTDTNPFATFTKPELIKVFALTIPEGATVVTADGTQITDGKVPVLSTVTVTIPVAAGQLYTIYVDGMPVETHAEDGKISATFDVGADSEVTYKASYKLNGTVSFGDEYPELKKDISLEGTEILVAGENGKIIYSATADKDGKFTVILPDGVFFIGAKGSTLVSDSLELTVEDGTASQELNLELVKPAVREQLFNLELKYDAKTGNYVSEYGHGQKAAGYLAGADVGSGKAYGVTVTMKDLGSDWPSGGFAIGTSVDKFVKFEIVKASDGTYILRIKDEVSNGEVLWWFRDIAEFRQYNSLSEFEFTVIYSGGNYYVFLEGNLLVTVPETQSLGSTTIKSSVGSGKTVHLGLYGEEKITFANWAYTTDSSDIKAVIGRKLTLADGLTATVNGVAVSDGEVLLGDTVTLSADVPAGKNYSIILDGKAIATRNEDGKATASFTVTGNHTIGFALSYAVSGSVEGGDSNTVITISTTDGVILYTGNGAAFETMLPDGEYVVTAQTAAQLSAGVKITVNGAAVEDIKVKADKLKITSVLQNFNDIPYDAATGELTVKGASQWNNGGYFGAVENGKPFVITATVRKFDGAWWSAGFAAGESTASFTRFVIRHRGDNGVYDIVSWNKTSTDQPALPEGLRGNPFTEAGDTMNIALVYNGGTYYFFVGDTIVHTVKEDNGNATMNVGLFCEQNVSYTDWGYSAELSEVGKYIGFTLTSKNAVLTVDGEEISEGKAMLGDVVTVIVDVESGTTVSIMLDGNAIATEIKDGKAYAQFIVTGNHTVTAAQTFDVTGSVTGGDADTVITIVNSNGGSVYTGKGTSFTTKLPDGKYYVTAQSAAKVSSAVEFTVDGESAEGVSVAVDKLKVTEKVFTDDLDFNLKTGYYGATQDRLSNGGYFAGEGVESGKAFVVTAVMQNMGENNVWPSAGLIIGSDAEHFVRLTIIHTGNGPYWMRLGNDKAGKEKVLTELSAEAFADGSEKLTAVYSNGLLHVFFGTKLVYTFDEINDGVTVAGSIGTGNIKAGLFAERQIEFTDWSFTDSEAEVRRYIGATVSGEGVTFSVDGKEVTDGKVFIGDEVTVTMDVEAGRNISFLLNDNAIDTENKDGKATAKFAVSATGEFKITFSSTYAVSGTTAANATVRFVNVEGIIVKTVEADQDGNFATQLPNGTYYASAETATAVSAIKTLTVKDGAVSETLTPDRIKITEKVLVGGESDNGNFKFDYKTGAYVSDSKPNNAAYFGTAANAADGLIVTAKVNKFTSDWYSAGFIVQTAEGNARFVLRVRPDQNPKRYDGSSWADGKTHYDFLGAEVFNPDLVNPFDGVDELALALVYKNGAYYFFIGDELAYRVTDYSAPTGKVGFFCENAITYTDWGFTTEVDELRKYVGAQVKGEGVEFSVGGKEPADGKVFVGDEVTISVEVEEGMEYSILVNGKLVQHTVTEGKAIATFTVTDPGNYAVTVTGPAEVGGTTEANAKVTFANSDGSIAKQTEADNEGKFTVKLPDGTYYVSAATDTNVSAITTVIVDGEAQTGIKLTVTRPLVTELAYDDNLKFNYATGALYNENEPQYAGGFLNGATVENGSDFELSVTMKNMAGIWPSAGLLVGTSKDEFVRFDLINNTTGNIFGLQVTVNPEKLVWLDNSVFAKPFGEDGKSPLTLKLVHHGGLYSVYFNGKLAGQFSGITFTDAPLKLGIYAERTITFTDWGFKTRNVEVPAEARLKGFDGVTAFNFDVNSGAFKSVWRNADQRSVTDIDVKDVNEWVYSADLHIMSDAQWPSVALALYNSDNSANYMAKIIRNCSNSAADDQWCQLKIGDKNSGTDYGADANGNSTQQWVEAHKTDMKNEVNMALVRNANGYYLFIMGELVWSATGDDAAAIANGWDNVYLGLFAEQETSVRNIKYSTDISGYEIPA